MNYATNGDQESGVFKTIRSLGKALGLAASILGTPMVYGATRWKMYAYLSATWDENLAHILTVVMAGVEAYVIYVTTTLVFTGLVIWAMAALAARRYSGGG